MIKNKEDSFILVKIIITKMFVLKRSFKTLCFAFWMCIYMSRIVLGRSLKNLLTVIPPEEGVTGHQGGRGMKKTFPCIPSISLFDLF